MASKSVTHGPLKCSVEISPSEVDAGTELAVTTRVACPHACDLTGQSVSIRDQGDVEVMRAELTALEEGTCITNPCTFLAPHTVGAHNWRAVFVDASKGR